MSKNYFRKIIFNRWSAVVHDIIWIPVSIILAFWFRFNLSEIPSEYMTGLYSFTLLALPAHAAFFWFFGLYRGIWRFASMPDLIRIIKSVTLGSLVSTMAGVILFKLDGVPRSVLVASPLFLITGLIGTRICYRIVKDKRLKLRHKDGRRTLIVGAGQAGDLLLRDLLTRQEYQPVAFVDDDKKKQGREIHGVRVCGKLIDIPKLILQFNIDLVLFAIPSINKKTIPQIIADCGVVNVEFKTLPSIHEKNSDQVNVGQLRPLTLDDLLGRDVVELDKKAIVSYLQGKIVLVTGSGGSIGSELCRQVAGLSPELLILFDNGEFNLYDIDHELRATFPALRIVTVLGDVKNIKRVEWVFDKFTPQVIFHAAAYKHVPMLEINPAEGVNNNVVGTRLVAEAADRYNAECFVMVSTDKAVNPVNVMGCTKRIAEIFCQNLASRSKTRYITTRFGNVLGSAGSVVPLFEKQIQKGGPVTVTHRDIKRYFMSISEAVNLILQAGSMGNGGEIYVLEMGEAILIRELAKQMILLSGLIPEKDIDIIYTGLRPGEKLYEELFHQSETLQKTLHSKLQLAESRPVSWFWLNQELVKLEETAGRRDIDKLLHHMKKIVPEYVRERIV